MGLNMLKERLHNRGETNTEKIKQMEKQGNY